VGQPHDGEFGFESGAAYVFERNLGGPDTWGQAARIVAADASRSARFGNSVSLDGDVAMVGAWGDQHNGPYSGSAHVFQRDHGGAGAWGQLRKLTASASSLGDQFGYSVAIDGDLAVAGAPHEEGSFPESGSVYVFQRDEGGAGVWGEQTKVPCPPMCSAIFDFFGQAVAISDATIAVGAPDFGTGFGYAHVFERDSPGAVSWDLVATLRPENVDIGGRFGETLDISGDTLVIGAYKADDYGTDSGTAYVFERDHGGSNAWGQIATLIPDDAQLYAFFGSSISISGDTVAVGAPGDDWFPGTTYIFQRDHGGPDTWGQVAKLRPSDLSGFEDRFGWSTAIDGDTVISGAPWHGAAYLFERDNGGPDAWGETAKITDVGGWIMALDGDTAVIDRSGEVVIVERDQGGPDSWGQTARITHPGGGGYHVSHSREFAISGDIVVIGAPYDTVNDLETGSAYAF
jgi:hypothetical protein